MMFRFAYPVLLVLLADLGLWEAAVLATESPWVIVNDADGSYGTLNPGVNGANSSDQFSLAISPECFQGHLATLTLTLTFNGAAIATTCRR